MNEIINLHKTYVDSNSISGTGKSSDPYSAIDKRIESLHSTPAYGKYWLPAKGGTNGWVPICCSSDGKIVYTAISPTNVYKSVNYGNDFNVILSASGLAWRSVACSAEGKYAFIVGDGGAYAYTSDYGANWTSSNTGIAYKKIACSSDGKYVTAVGYTGIYTSDNYGVSFTFRNYVFNHHSVCMSSNGQIQVTVCYNGYIYLSTDYGVTWTQKGTSTFYRDVKCSSDGSKIFAGTEGYYLYKSTDSGANWAQDTSAGQYSEGVSVSSDGLIIVTPLYYSSNGATSWTALVSPPANPTQICMALDGSRLFWAISAVGLFVSYSRFYSPIAQVSPVVESEVKQISPITQSPSIIGGEDRSGSNQNGTNIALRAGLSTGTGIATASIDRVGRTGSSGSAVNTSQRAVIVPPRKYLTDNLAISLFEVALPNSGDTCGLFFSYRIHCWNGTDFQSHSGACNVVAGNKAGTVTSAIGHSSGVGGLEVEINSSGTLTDTWAVTNGSGKITVTVNANSSLTPSTDQLWIEYILENNSMMAVTIL